jgi:hypothetical protein
MYAISVDFFVKKNEKIDFKKIIEDLIKNGCVYEGEYSLDNHSRIYSDLKEAKEEISNATKICSLRFKIDNMQFSLLYRPAVKNKNKLKSIQIFNPLDIIERKFSVVNFYFDRSFVGMTATKEQKENVKNVIKLAKTIYENLHCYTASYGEEEDFVNMIYKPLADGKVKSFCWINIFPPGMLTEREKKIILGKTKVFHKEELDDGAVLLVIANNPIFWGDAQNSCDHYKVVREIKKLLGWKITEYEMNPGHQIKENGGEHK